MALGTGQLDSVVSQFGVDGARVAAHGGGSNGFIEAVNEAEGSKDAQGGNDDMDSSA